MLFIGTEIDGQLMGEFEADAKGLEADSWSLTADKKYLKHLKKDVIKQQDVIYGRVTCGKRMFMPEPVTSSFLNRLICWTLYNICTAVGRSLMCFMASVLAEKCHLNSFVLNCWTEF